MKSKQEYCNEADCDPKEQGLIPLAIAPGELFWDGDRQGDRQKGEEKVISPFRVDDPGISGCLHGETARPITHRLSEVTGPGSSFLGNFPNKK